jgi:hypothetical protein
MDGRTKSTPIQFDGYGRAWQKVLAVDFGHPEIPGYFT